jgi:hypothetical protein
MFIFIKELRTSSLIGFVVVVKLPYINIWLVYALQPPSFLSLKNLSKSNTEGINRIIIKSALVFPNCPSKS